MTLAIAALSSAVGCTLEPTEIDEVGAHVAPIKDGYEDAEDTAVMALTHPADGRLCSGSLIAPNVLLTARHCVSSTNSGTAVDCTSTRFQGVDSPVGYYVTAATEVTPSNAAEYPAAEIVGLAGIPGIPASVTDDAPLCGNDMVIVILADNIPAAVATPYEPVLEGALEVGLSYYAVGYGAVNGSGQDAGTRRRRDDLTLTCEDEAACATAEIDDVADGEWVGTGGICSGDSGGPALDLSDRVFGVTSRGDAECELSVYATTTAHAQWIKDATVFASGMGAYDAPAWTAGSTVNPETARPVGASCTDGSDCPSGICIQDEAGPYCSRLCTDEGPCPKDYECTGEGEKVCTKRPPPLPVGPFKRAPKDGCSYSAVTGSGDASWLFGVMIGAALWRRRQHR